MDGMARAGHAVSAFDRSAGSLFQCGKIGPEIDVIGLAVDNERRDGLHARCLGLAEPAPIGAQMNDLDIECCRIERRRKTLLGVDADTASGVIEGGFLFQAVSPLEVAGRKWKACAQAYLSLRMITPGSERLPEATL